MKKKRLLLIAGAMAAVVGLTLGVPALLPPRPGIDGWSDDRSVWQKMVDRLPWSEKQRRLPLPIE